MGARPGSGWSIAAAWAAADLVLLLVIWLTALVVGGIVGFKVAQLSTLICAVAWLLGPTRDRRTARGCLLVGAVTVIVVQGAFPRAPSTSDLPLAGSVSVIASASGGSDLDGAEGHRYRYLALAGPQPISGSVLLNDELRRLISQGWDCTIDKLIHLKPRDESYDVLPRRCPTPLPRASVTLISIGENLRIDLTVLSGQADADQNADGTPLEGNHGLHRALQNQQPVLWADLAHET